MSDFRSIGAIIVGAWSLSACGSAEPLEGYDRLQLNYGSHWGEWSETVIYPDGRVESRFCKRDCRKDGADGNSVSTGRQLNDSELQQVARVFRAEESRAVPIDQFAVGEWHSPDGGECTDLTMDAGGMGLIWVTNGEEEVVGIDFGCDATRHAATYDELRSLLDMLVPELAR